jgi:ribonuclease HI
MFFDGSLNINGAGAGILFVSPNKDKLGYVLRILFPASNNMAEYEACLHGIRLAVELGVKRLYIHGDFALVINQLNKEWDTTHKKNGFVLQGDSQMGSNFLWNRVHTCGPGQESSSKCAIKDWTISGSDRARHFRLGPCQAER